MTRQRCDYHLAPRCKGLRRGVTFRGEEGGRLCCQACATVLVRAIEEKLAEERPELLAKVRGTR